MSQTQIVANVSGVSAGGTTTATCTLGVRHLKHRIHATGKDASNNPLKAEDIIEYIQSSVSSVMMMDMTPKEIRARNKAVMSKLYFWDEPDNEITLFYADPSRATVMEEKATAVDTFGQTSFLHKIKIKPGVVDPQLRILETFDYGYLRNDKGERTLAAIKTERGGMNIGKGNTDIGIIKNAYPIQRIWFYGTKQINNLEVYSGSTKIYESTRDENARHNSDYGFDSGTFGEKTSYPMLFDYDNQLFASGLLSSSALKFRVNSEDAQFLDWLVEYRMPQYV